MLIPILIFDVALVAWSLHLMQESFHKREFSLLLAGLLVSLSAGGLMVVYVLMNHCMSSLAQMS